MVHPLSEPWVLSFCRFILIQIVLKFPRPKPFIHTEKGCVLYRVQLFQIAKILFRAQHLHVEIYSSKHLWNTVHFTCASPFSCFQNINTVFHIFSYTLYNMPAYTLFKHGNVCGLYHNPVKDLALQSHWEKFRDRGTARWDKIFTAERKHFFSGFGLIFCSNLWWRQKKKTAGFEQARNQDFVKKGWSLN